MKKTYQTPELELLILDPSDIVAVSYNEDDVEDINTVDAGWFNTQE